MAPCNPSGHETNGGCSLVPCHTPDMGELDSIEDIIREAVSRNQPVMPILNAWREAERIDAQCEAITAAFAFIDGYKNKHLAIDLIQLRFGISAAKGLSGSDIAKKYGCSKQAMQQHEKRLDEKLPCRKNAHMRGREARVTMRVSNYRKCKA